MIAVIPSMAIPYFVCRKRNIHAGICCFVVAWQILVWDAFRQLMDVFRSLGTYKSWMEPVEDNWFRLIESLLVLTVPLVFLCVALLFSHEQEHKVSRNMRLLIVSCCLSLADLILMIVFLAIFLLPISVVSRVFPGIRF